MMKSAQPRYLTTVAVVLLTAAAFLVGLKINDPHGDRPLYAALSPSGLSAPISTSTVSLKPVQLFQEALTRVQMEYIQPIDNPDELAYAAIRGMLASLNDPYTRFMDPKEYKEFNSDNAGRFAGIGATLNMQEIPAAAVKEGEGTTAPVQCPVCGTEITASKHYRVGVVDTLPGSPARAAGLQPGDFIMKVDGTSTDGLVVSQVADKIRGEEGSQVTLEIVRKGGQPFEVKITRAQIEVPAVESKILDGNIGYLRLFQFNEKTVEETRAALMDFRNANVNGVLLDLRNNPGGLLTECIKVASMFLPPDKQLIVSTKERTGLREDYNRVNERFVFDKPMVVLVNKGSASASEILSGALQDHGRAKLVGESTFGKALVQTVIRLGDRDNPSAMAITTAHYYTPSGSDIAKIGIKPNIEVALDKDVKKADETDNQAQAALRELQNAIANR